MVLVQFQLIENQNVIYTSSLVGSENIQAARNEIAYQIKVNKCD